MFYDGSVYAVAAKRVLTRAVNCVETVQRPPNGPDVQHAFVCFRYGLYFATDYSGVR